MDASVLVVCRANVCRSPVAAALFAAAFPRAKVDSAGLDAAPGQRADPRMVEAMAAAGFDLRAHRSKRIEPQLAAAHDLILVMERKQRLHLAARIPPVTGRVMMLSHWLAEGPEIADPYGRSENDYTKAIDLIERSVSAWAERIGEAERSGAAKN